MWRWGPNCGMAPMGGLGRSIRLMRMRCCSVRSMSIATVGCRTQSIVSGLSKFSDFRGGNVLHKEKVRCCSSGSGRIDVAVPQMGDSITEGTISEWKVGEGEYVEADGIVAIIDTDKVSVDINAPDGGTVIQHKAAEGDTVEVGGPLYTFEPGPPPEGAARSKSSEVSSPSDKETSSSSPPASSPQKREDETLKKPSSEKDKTALKKQMPASSSSSSPSAPQQTSTGSPSSASTPHPSSSSSPSPSASSSQRAEHRVPMSRLRLRVAERLKDAQNTAAMLTTFNECDMGDLMALRSEMNDAFQKKHGCKIGFVSAFMAAATKALQNIPAVNAQIERNEIVYKDYVDMSVAVATPSGLMVPVIRDCQTKSLPQLEKDLADLAVRARAGKITLEDMAGGSFTISNGGVFGSMMGTPILNPPQSSILGLHSIVERPVARKGQVVIRPIMYLALTYDHRLIDGKEAVTFLKTIRDYVQDPRTLLLDI